MTVTRNSKGSFFYPWYLKPTIIKYFKKSIKNQINGLYSGWVYSKWSLSFGFPLVLRPSSRVLKRQWHRMRENILCVYPWSKILFKETWTWASFNVFIYIIMIKNFSNWNMAESIGLDNNWWKYKFVFAMDLSFKNANVIFSLKLHFF